MLTFVGLSVAGAVIAAFVGTIWFSQAAKVGRLYMRYLKFDVLSKSEQDAKIAEAMPQNLVRQLVLFVVCDFILVAILVACWVGQKSASEPVSSPVVVSEVTESSDVLPTAIAPTERYQAQVDRVRVLFEQWDYSRYRLQTNDLVREGALTTERGFGDDVEAIVYILNSDKAPSEQIRYVQLTNEPQYLSYIGSDGAVIGSGKLQLAH